MSRHFLFIIVLLLTLQSCRQAKTTEVGKPAAQNQVKAVSMLKPQSVGTTPATNLDTVRIDFDDFTLFLPDVEVYQSDSARKKDTIEISPDLLYDLDSQVVIIRTKPGIREIEVFESFKTVLSVTNEGPHYDLYDWKGFESEWMKVKTLSKDRFMLCSISEGEASTFPAFTKEELLEEADKIEKSVGDLIRKPSYGTWKDHFWIGVGIRRLKFVLKHTDGRVSEKYLIAYMPMGC